MRRFAMLVLMVASSVSIAADGDFDPFEAYLEEQKNGSEYWNCLTNNIMELDDGVSPAKQIAELCHDMCKFKYHEWLMFRAKQRGGDVREPSITDKPSDIEIFDAMKKVLEYRRMKSQGKNPSIEWRTKSF